LLLIFFLVGDRIKWDILLTGLAWRTWMLLTILPAAPNVGAPRWIML
jgi:hypothetical protein